MRSNLFASFFSCFLLFFSFTISFSFSIFLSVSCHLSKSTTLGRSATCPAFAASAARSMSMDEVSEKTDGDSATSSSSLSGNGGTNACNAKILTKHEPQTTPAPCPRLSTGNMKRGLNTDASGRGNCQLPNKLPGKCSCFNHRIALTTPAGGGKSESTVLPGHRLWKSRMCWGISLLFQTLASCSMMS